MGYKRPKKVYRLTFPEPDMAGFEATLEGLTLDEFLKLTGLTDAGGLAPVDATREVFRMLAAALVSWNLEDDDGSPVPATEAGVLAQDVGFVFQIVLKWIDEIGGVPPPSPAELERWRAVPGGVDSDGAVVSEPFELTRAKAILMLCDRFHVTPDVAGEMDAGVFRLLAIERLETPPEEVSSAEPG